MNIYSVFWGDKYAPEYVVRLRDAVAKHLPIEHRFICITDHEFEDVETIKPVVDWPGWWQKVSLFSSTIQGPWLYFDLDVVITGDLSPLAEYTEHGLAAPANWAQSGHGGIQSSVMASNGELKTPFELFNPESARWPPVNQPGILWGDQEYLALLYNTGQIYWTQIDPTLIRSYKYHCRNGLPDNCRVVVFHGAPKPHEVSEPWML